MSAVVRERVGWDLASAALFVVIVILAFTLPPRFPGSSWFLVATAVGIAAVYAFGARRYVSLREGPEPSPAVSWLLQAALIALLAIGTSIEPTMMLLQTIVLPLIWMTSRSTRQSILVTLLNAVVLSIAYAASDGFSPGMLLAGIVTSGLSAAFSIALGLWITRIAEWGTERQRLLADLTAAQHGLEAASRESGAAAERARLAREVHDTIAQSLTSIVMLAERSRLDGSHEAIALIEDAAREALREARALVVVESSAADPTGSLAEALRRLGERFSRETGLPVSVDASPLVVRRDLEVVLLRCAQEGLANVRKHAAAGAASLVLSIDDDAVLVVSDDGRGLGGARPDGADIGAGGGFGLAGMRDRVALVGGTLEARDGEAAGTTLTVRIPLAAEQETA